MWLSGLRHSASTTTLQDMVNTWPRSSAYTHPAFTCQESRTAMRWQEKPFQWFKLFCQDSWSKGWTVCLRVAFVTTATVLWHVTLCNLVDTSHPRKQQSLMELNLGQDVECKVLSRVWKNCERLVLHLYTSRSNGGLTTALACKGFVSHPRPMPLITM
jgi:hypothetical protein